MGIRSSLAETVCRSSRWVMRRVFHRTGGNLPGMLALKVDGQLLDHLAYRISDGIIISATNGKTTTTGLTANVIDLSRKVQGLPLVVCNRDGNNMTRGIVTEIMSQPRSLRDATVVLECDELYTAQTLPALKPRYFMLMNLFRDQLDRFGEIDHVQDVFVKALAGTPGTTFVYNADDPFCEAVARRISNPTISFGIDEDLHQAANRVAESRFCQSCGAALDYDFATYGQMGAFRCPECDFKRADLDFAVRNIRDYGQGGYQFDVVYDGGARSASIQMSYTGVYMIYNILAAFTASILMGADEASFAQGLAEYNPGNGRLQTFHVGRYDAMSNLSKNPVGFNQNIQMLLRAKASAVAFFINDNDADGHDISWIWDIDFENLCSDPTLTVYAGGTRANDLQVRLKYAGIRAELIEDTRDALFKMDRDGIDAARPVYFVANYTALPAVRADLTALSKEDAR